MRPALNRPVYSRKGLKRELGLQIANSRLNTFLLHHHDVAPWATPPPVPPITSLRRSGSLETSAVVRLAPGPDMTHSPDNGGSASGSNVADRPCRCELTAHLAFRVDSTRADQLLLLPGLCAAVRTGASEREGHPRPARSHRHRCRQDLRHRGAFARGEARGRRGDERRRAQGRRGRSQCRQGDQRLAGQLAARRQRPLQWRLVEARCRREGGHLRQRCRGGDVSNHAHRQRRSDARRQPT